MSGPAEANCGQPRGREPWPALLRALEPVLRSRDTLQCERSYRRGSVFTHTRDLNFFLPCVPRPHRGHPRGHLHIQKKKKGCHQSLMTEGHVRGCLFLLTPGFFPTPLLDKPFFGVERSGIRLLKLQRPSRANKKLEKPIAWDSCTCTYIMERVGTLRWATSLVHGVEKRMGQKSDGMKTTCRSRLSHGVCPATVQAQQLPSQLKAIW